MGILEGFFRALSFLTILPCPKRESTVEEYGRASGWFPVAGAVLGAILYAAALLFHRFFSPLPASALVVALWAFLTRGFHLDGLADTFDGIGGGFDRESRLAVMKDSRLGTFGGTALAAALLLKTVILAEFGGRLEVLVLAPVLGRWGILIAMRYFPSARPGGMGDTFRKQCGKPQLILGSLAALWTVLLLSGLHGLPLLGIVPALTVLFSLWLKRLLGGLTGDSYGAVCEIVELTTLFFFAAL